MSSTARQHFSSPSSLTDVPAPEDAAALRERRRAEVRAWKAIVARYEVPRFWPACWQLLNTLGAYVLLWYLMSLSLRVSWWLAVPLAVLGGGFLVRTFIIFHDCGHGSFFRSRTANTFWGFVAGVLTVTPFYHWRWEHDLHHKTAADLDRRGVGDIWTLTVQEYLQASRWKKFAYRLARNPVLLFVVAPVFMFAFRQRLPSPKASPRERRSVWWMNLAILGMATVLSLLVGGVVPYLILHFIIIAVGGTAGIWLFYVQHQFEEVYWERGGDWDYTSAALKGSSFYKLPRVLQWFSGSIGFHHVHHLSPRIPNYNLEACHRSDPMFHEVKPLTLLSSFRSLTFRLWDESARRLVGFRKLREYRKGRTTP